MDKKATYSYRGSWIRQEVHRVWIQKKTTNYGIRWLIEGFSIKRKLAEDLRARSVIGLLGEAIQKVCAYDLVSFSNSYNNTASYGKGFTSLI